MEKMRRFAVLFAFILFLTACSGGQQGTQNEPAENPPAIAPISGDGLVIENGMVQQIASYTDPMKEDYTNEGSELLRFVVYVETDNDTDMDGKPDLVKTMVQVPLQAASGVYKAPVIYEARPYIGGMYAYQPQLPVAGEYEFDIADMYAQPEKRTPAGSVSTLQHAAAVDPSDWVYTFENDPFQQQFMGNLTTYDYYLVRGYAVVQSAGLGTWGSEGLEVCCSQAEADAFRCIADNVKSVTKKQNTASYETASCLLKVL